MGRVDLKSMPMVTVEQVARFREAAIAENSALLKLVRVQHEALSSFIQAEEVMAETGFDDAIYESADQARAAITKYNEMMGDK